MVRPRNEVGVALARDRLGEALIQGGRRELGVDYEGVGVDAALLDPGAKEGVVRSLLLDRAPGGAGERVPDHSP